MTERDSGALGEGLRPRRNRGPEVSPTLFTAARSKILKKQREIDKCRTSVGLPGSLAAPPSIEPIQKP